MYELMIKYAYQLYAYCMQRRALCRSSCSILKEKVYDLERSLSHVYVSRKHNFPCSFANTATKMAIQLCGSPVDVI